MSTIRYNYPDERLVEIKIKVGLYCTNHINDYLKSVSTIQKYVTSEKRRLENMINISPSVFEFEIFTIIVFFVD